MRCLFQFPGCTFVVVPKSLSVVSVVSILLFYSIAFLFKIIFLFFLQLIIFVSINMGWCDSTILLTLYGLLMIVCVFSVGSWLNESFVNLLLFLWQSRN